MKRGSVNQEESREGKDILLDLSKEYGLVLEGGGAKGAFQIGAWKALREAGIRIKGVAGVSVGALNGALICMDDLEKAEAIWQDISYGQVMEINGRLIEKLTSLGGKLAEFNLQEIKKIGLSETLQEAAEEIKNLLKDRGLDITPLKNLIRENIDEQRIRESACELYATTYSLSDKKLYQVDVKKQPEGEIGDILLASAYLPVFKTEKLGGKLYTDGGGFNNVPLDVLINRGYEDIIVIRIYGLGMDREKKIKIPEGTNVYHIAPKEELGGTLEFSKKRSRKNMTLGYLEAKRFLYGLMGRRYYIYAPYEEPYYFDRMMAEMELLKLYLEAELEQPELSILNSYRFYTETVFPALSKKLRLKENWDYKELYLAIIEGLAGKLKIFRYQIYTVDQLVTTIKKTLLISQISGFTKQAEQNTNPRA